VPLPTPKARLALASLPLLLAVAASPASAADRSERFVVRGEATAVDGPCDARACRVQLADGEFRGTPVGTGSYAGSLKLSIGAAFPNGEDGSCAPLESRVVLGAGSADRLVLAVEGDSCQDGAGPLPAASFTGLARFTVKHGRGRYDRAGGYGLALFTEDAANRHRMTLIGRITR
jgi:hypothetical protein